MGRFSPFLPPRPSYFTFLISMSITTTTIIIKARKRIDRDFNIDNTPLGIYSLPFYVLTSPLSHSSYRSLWRRRRRKKKETLIPKENKNNSL